METKRQLTDSEKEAVLAQFPRPPARMLTQNSVYDRTMRELRKQMDRIEIYPSMLPEFSKIALDMHTKSLVPPGENVGILTAQGIGEKQTQLSVERHEHVYICSGHGRTKSITRVEIGEFVDMLMTTYSAETQHLPHMPQSFALDISAFHIYTVSLSRDARVCMQRISAVTKHPPHGRLARFYTTSGRSVCVTLSHSLLRLDPVTQRVEPVVAGLVKIGDKIPVVQNLSHFHGSSHTARHTDYDMSWFLGYFTRYGHLANNDTELVFTRTDARLVAMVAEMKWGLGYTDSNSVVVVPTPSVLLHIKNTMANGMVGVIRTVKYADQFFMGALHNMPYGCLRFAMGHTDNWCFMLARLGVRAHVITTRAAASSAHIRLDIHDAAHLANAYGIRFNRQSRWRLKLYPKDTAARVLRHDVEWDAIVRIEKVWVDENDFVYDFTVPGHETFMLANGVFVHNTLNSFHHTGVAIKTLVTGVPRFMELMNTTKDPKGKSCKLRLSAATAAAAGTTVRGVRDALGYSLVHITLGMLKTDWRVMECSQATDWWHMLSAERRQHADHTLFLRVFLCKKIIGQYRLSLSAMETNLAQHFPDLYICASSMNEAIIDVFVRNVSALVMPKAQVSYITTDNRELIFLEEVVLKALDKHTLFGIDGIDHFVIHTDKNNEWAIETEGSNMLKLLGHPLLDSTKCVSNNMWEILEFLGIEATREFLINEFMTVISADGYINTRHVALLVDTMTFRGDITSVSRYGLRNKASPMARSSFEESVENFIKSGIFCETDNVQSVSSNIMIAKLSHTGTGICDILMDADTASPTLKLYKTEQYQITPSSIMLDPKGGFIENMAKISH